MTSELRIERAIAVPTPDKFAAYLRQSGWTSVATDASWARYRRVVEGTEETLEVPQKAAARDYPRAIRLVLDDLARLEGRGHDAIVRDVAATSVDIVRLQIRSAKTEDGRIPVDAGVRVYEATRALVLGAACSALEPRAAYSKRKPDKAMAVLDAARFGQSEMGSFVLTVECAVPPMLGVPLFPDDPDPDSPLERRTMLRLATGVEGAVAACRESAQEPSLEPFKNRMSSGVSANLCEALAEIVQATEAAEVITSVSFAPIRPVVGPARRVSTILGTHGALLREAATRLRAESPSTDYELAGAVVRLQSQEPDRGGIVTIAAAIDDRPRKVEVQLGREDYAQAIKAHEALALVRVTGELTRAGRSWRLTQPRSFARVADED